MQRTRINTIITSSTIKLNRVLINPWRRIVLNITSLFFGVFIGQGLSTTAGQSGILDVTSSALIVLFAEGVSRAFYSSTNPKNSLGLTILNLFKIGIIYTLFLEAFKVGS